MSCGKQLRYRVRELEMQKEALKKAREDDAERISDLNMMLFHAKDLLRDAESTKEEREKTLAVAVQEARNLSGQVEILKVEKAVAEKQLAEERHNILQQHNVLCTLLRFLQANEDVIDDLLCIIEGRTILSPNEVMEVAGKLRKTQGKMKQFIDRVKDDCKES